MNKKNKEKKVSELKKNVCTFCLYCSLYMMCLIIKPRIIDFCFELFMNLNLELWHGSSTVFAAKILFQDQNIFL